MVVNITLPNEESLTHAHISIVEHHGTTVRDVHGCPVTFDDSFVIRDDIWMRPIVFMLHNIVCMPLFTLRRPVKHTIPPMMLSSLRCDGVTRAELKSSRNISINHSINQQRFQLNEMSLLDVNMHSKPSGHGNWLLVAFLFILCNLYRVKLLATTHSFDKMLMAPTVPGRRILVEKHPFCCT